MTEGTSERWGRGPVQEDASLAEYVAVAWRRRWLIAAVCVVSILAALTYALRTPRTYESTTTILIPKEAGAASGVLSGIAVTALLQQVAGLSIPSLAPNRDMLMSVLKSRRLAEKVVERFQLQARYRARFVEDAIRQLRNVTDISVAKEGVIAVRIEDRDPRLAADMANFYVEQLDRLIAGFNVGEAGRQRGFVTEQLAGAKSDLEVAENKLRRFQERNRAIVLQEQTKGAIEAAARLKGEVMAAEVQLEAMRNFATDANPEMVFLRRRIEEMKRQLAQFQYGDGVSEDRRDFTVPFPKVPEVGIELVRLTREVKVQETLVTLLTQQLEQAKIAEAKDLPVVQVLDRAVPAERHSRPKLFLNTVLAGVASLFAAVSLTFFLEYLKNLGSRPRQA